MNELTLLLMRIGFLVLLWLFVFGVVYSLRADLFGVRVRKLPADAVPQGAPAAVSHEPVRPVQQSQPTQPAHPASVSKLLITSGPKTGLELPLGTEPMTIGRSAESGLVIRDDYTSSHHARLQLRGGVWFIQDLDSTNGTFLGDSRVGSSPVPIPPGTPVKVGATTFELRA